MKNLAIVQFSPTGGTRKILESIAKGTGMRVARILDLASAEVREAPPPVIEEDLTIIGLPVYALGIPAIVLPWLECLKGAGKAAVLVAVYGNITPGIALPHMASIAEASRFRVLAAASFVAEHTFSTAASPVAAGRPDEEDLGIAADFGRRVALALEEDTVSSPAALGIPRIGPAALALKKRQTFNSSRLYARTPAFAPELCARCGLCARICPAGAIDPPSLAVAGKACIRCCACVKLCPAGARALSFRMGAPIPRLLSRKGAEPKRPRLYFPGAPGAISHPSGTESPC